MGPTTTLFHYKSQDDKNNKSNNNSHNDTLDTPPSNPLLCGNSSSSCISNDEDQDQQQQQQLLQIPMLQRVVDDLQLTQKEFGFHHPKVAHAWSALGLVKIHMQRDPEQALLCHEHALRIFRDNNTASSSCYDTEIAITLNDVAACHEQLQQTKQALQLYQESYQIMKEQGVSEYHPHLVSTTRALARLGRE